MKNLILIAFILLSTLVTKGQSTYQRIDDFIVKENLTSNGKIAIIVVDSAETALDNIHGTFKFTINGFEQTLNFHNGVAVPANPIESSTFVFFKHKNQEKTTGKMYFLYKKDNKITPIKINGLLLIIIPALLLLIAYTFKRLLMTFVILAIIYSYFSLSKGLSITQILESAFQVIKNLI